MTPDVTVSTGPANFMLITPGPNDLFAVEYRSQNHSAVHHIKMPGSEDSGYQALKVSVAAFSEHEISRHTSYGGSLSVPPEHYFEIHEAQALINEEEWLCTEEEAFYDSVPVQAHTSLAEFYKAICFDPAEKCYTK